MHPSRLVQLILLVGVVALVLVGGYALAQKTAPDAVTLPAEGTKLGPVPFPHKVHADKEKIDCAKCHHKEKDMKEAQKCSACHLPKEVKDNAPIAKDAYHKNCQTCHKETLEKGKKAPTNKCNECHKR